MLKFQNVFKTYEDKNSPKTVLEDVSFEWKVTVIICTLR